MSTNWSAQQNNIFDWFKTGVVKEYDIHKSLLVRARAGTGKTTTIVEGINHSPENRILLAAFNKDIATELSLKLKNPKAEAATLHSTGFRQLRRNWTGIKVDSKRGDDLARQAAGVTAPDTVINIIRKLASLGKNIIPINPTLDEMMDVAESFDLLKEENTGNSWDDTRICSLAIEAMKLALKKDGLCDFDDMIYVPVANNWIVPTYDLVVVDECFPGDTPVLLSDKTTKTIKEIVENKLPVSVLSYNEQTKMQVVKKVIDYKKILLKKKTYRIKVREKFLNLKGEFLGLGYANRPGGKRALVCTEDHLIYTNEGWKKVQNLKPGDIVQVENGAPKDRRYNQKYMHSVEGKKNLSKSITKSNNIYNMSKPPAKGVFKGQRGGNGKLSLPQIELLKELGKGWLPEFVVRTHKGKLKGYPPCYKIDIANPSCKIGIEVDGRGHSRKSGTIKDKKKDTLLTSLGWTIIRIKNKDALRNTKEISDKIKENECPVDAMVVEIEEHGIKDNFVYDLTVEDTHCYYAHGILVHNCQDMNVSQLILCQRLVKKDGRIVVVGDDRQAIYGFRGADSTSLDRLKAELNCLELPLTITYRCPKLVVDLAATIVPDYTAAPNCIDGLVAYTKPEQMFSDVTIGDFVLSRKNAPLAGIALRLLREGKRTIIKGKDIGAGLVALTKRIKANSVPDFLRKLSTYEEKHTTRLMASKKNAQIKIDLFKDQCETLRSLAEGLANINEIRTRIETLFTDVDAKTGKNVIMCSSVHKAKGMESTNVWLLKDTLRTECGGEESNIAYVAYTRAKQSLYMVEGVK